MNNVIEWRSYNLKPDNPGRYFVKMWDMAANIVLVDILIYQNGWPQTEWPVYSWAEIPKYV